MFDAENTVELIKEGVKNGHYVSFEDALDSEAMNAQELIREYIRELRFLLADELAEEEN